MAQIVAVHGVQATVQYLRRFEKEAYKDIKKQMILRAKPTVQAVRKEFPKDPWSSSRGVNWTKYGRTERGRKSPGDAGASFPRYQQSRVKAGVKADDGSRRRRADGTYTILRIKQTDSAGSIYDLAKNNKTRGKESFVRQLNKSKRGKPNSRVMWSTVQKHIPKLTRDVDMILQRLESKFTTEIALDGERRLAASKRASVQTRNVLGQFGKGIR
jgi:hypothetical protein